MAPVHVSSWASDRDILGIYSQSASDYFIGFLSIHEKSMTQRVAAEGVVLLFPDYSPDGKWVAYSSVRTGRHEIWVRSVGDGETVRQITTEGGLEPVWGANGEIFYRTGNRWMVVSIRTEPELEWDPPQFLFSTDFIDTPNGTWDVSPDGARIFLFKSTGQYDRTKLRLVGNWFEELNRLLDLVR